MENDTSPCASPGEGLIYDGSGPGHSSAPRGARAVCGGINSVLLATSVKDALRMGYLLLFIVEVPAQQRGGWSLSLAPARLPP